MKLLRFLVASILSIVFWSCSDDAQNSEDSRLPDTDVELSTTSTAEDSEGNIYEVGFDQVSNINQDPFVRKKNTDGETIWSVAHEKSEVDVRASHIFVDEDDTPWVVFSIVGGSYNDEYITELALERDAFSGVYQNSYGVGGGTKVSIIARLNPTTGKIAKATFVTARKNDGKTNGFAIKTLGKNNGHIAFDAESVAWPPTTGTSYKKYPDITDEDRIDGSFKMYYEINTDLTEIVEATLK